MAGTRMAMRGWVLPSAWLFLCLCGGLFPLVLCERSGAEPIAWSEAGWAESMDPSSMVVPFIWMQRPTFDGPPRYGGRPYAALDHERLVLWEFGGGATWYATNVGTLRRVPVRNRPAIVALDPGGTWQPGPRFGGAAVVDPVAQRFVSFGGVSQQPGLSSPEPKETASISITDPGAGWTLWDIPNPLPSRSSIQGVYDPVHHRMLVYGGRNWAGIDVGQSLAALSLTVGEEQWYEVDTGGIVPPGKQERTAHALIFDRTRYELIVAGGGVGFTKYGDGGGLGDVWALSLAEPEAGWRELVALNAAPHTYFACEGAAHDPDRDWYILAQCRFPEEKADFASATYESWTTRLWAIRRVGESGYEWVETRSVIPYGVASVAQAHWHWETQAGYQGSGMAPIYKVLAHPRRVRVLGGAAP